MLQNGNMISEENKNKLKIMRKYIYNIESANLHKKTPKKDSDMVDEIINYVRQQSAKENDQ